jgi:hypothetical protein
MNPRRWLRQATAGGAGRADSRTSKPNVHTKVSAKRERPAAIIVTGGLSGPSVMSVKLRGASNINVLAMMPDKVYERYMRTLFLSGDEEVTYCGVTSEAQHSIPQ